MITKKAKLEERLPRLEQYCLGRYWLDIGIGALVLGFVMQVLATIL